MKKLTLEEFGAVMKSALYEQSLTPGLRLGQCIFNATNFYFPGLANSLRATGADCFYNDNKIIYFVNAIVE